MIVIGIHMLLSIPPCARRSVLHEQDGAERGRGEANAEMHQGQPPDKGADEKAY